MPLYHFVFFDVACKVDASAGEPEEEVVGVLETGEVLVNGHQILQYL